MISKKTFAIIITIVLCIFIGRSIWLSLPKFTPPDEAITLENAHKIELIDELHYGQTKEIAFSNDGNLLFVAKGTQFMILDMNTGKQIHKIGLGDTNNKFDVGQSDIVAKFSPNDRYLAVGRSDPENLRWGSVQVWNTSDWQKIDIPSRQGAVTGIDFSFNNQFLSYASFGGNGFRTSNVYIVDLSTKKELKEFTDVIAIAFSPSDSYFAYSSNGVHIWDYKEDTITKLPDFSSQRPLIFTPNGKLLIGSNLSIWDFQQNQLLDILSQAQERRIGLIAISPDSKLLAYSSVDSNRENPEITVFDLVARTTKYNLSGHTDRVTGLAFSPDSNLLISTGDYEFKIWNMQNGTEIKELQSEDEVWRPIVDVKSKLIISRTEGGKVQLWGIPNE
jgi:WD40 repeat protein